jgi:hypothetical protein
MFESPTVEELLNIEQYFNDFFLLNSNFNLKLELGRLLILLGKAFDDLDA